MNLSQETCYRAVQSRDERFDGKFFTAVLTTGIYCRPVCPARTPKPENVRFYACAAAAQTAGFRPCRRCRPETLPGTTPWIGTSATVSRALRLIADGALDDGGLEDLADRVGIGTRHLRRLFQDELGTSPLAVAQTRRVHFAAKLLEETSLPIGDIAFSAGFGSIRRFNDAIRQAFGQTPTELRQSSGRFLVFHEQKLRLRLPVTAPYDWDGVIRFLAPRAIPGVEAVDVRSYRRTFRLGETVGALEVTPIDDDSALRLSVTPMDIKLLNRLVERVRRLFDCGAPLTQINEHLGKDPRLEPLVTRTPGRRVPGAFDGFELAVRAVLGQQVSVAQATRLAGELVARFGTKHDAVEYPGLTHVFPTPEKLATVDPTTLNLPSVRAKAIVALAKLVTETPSALTASAGLSETEARLIEIPGIGPWTANYIAMRALGEPDAFPASDLGLRKAASGTGEPLMERQLETLAEAWHPWRAYAAMHLWMSLGERETV